MIDYENPAPLKWAEVQYGDVIRARRPARRGKRLITVMVVIGFNEEEIFLTTVKATVKKNGDRKFWASSNMAERLCISKENFENFCFERGNIVSYIPEPIYHKHELKWREESHRPLPEGKAKDFQLAFWYTDMRHKVGMDAGTIIPAAELPAVMLKIFNLGMNVMLQHGGPVDVLWVDDKRFQVR